eukprot:gene23847-30941_t
MEQQVAVSGGKSVALSNALKVIQEIIAQKIQQEVSQESHISPVPTPTEHFALIIAMLSSPSSSPSLSTLSSTFLPEILKILIAVLPKCNPKVVRQQFKLVVKVIIGLLHANISATRKDSQNENGRNIIAQLCLQSMAELMLLISLKSTISSNDAIASDWLKAINCFLSFIDDSRDKIRRLVHQHILKLMTAAKSITHGYVSEFCVEVLKSCSRSQHQRSFYVIALFEAGCLAHTPSASLLPAVEAALSLQHCGVNRLTAVVYKMLDSFFQLCSQLRNSNTKEQSEQIVAMGRCLEALLRCPPANTDMESNSFYCTALASGVVYMCKAEGGMSIESNLSGTVLNIVKALSISCESEFLQVHCAVGAALKRVISVVLDEKTLSHFVQSDNIKSSGEEKLRVDVFSKQQKKKTTPEFIPSLLTHIEQLLQLKLQLSWPFTLDVVRSLLETFKNCGASTSPKLCSLIRPIVVRLADVYQAVESLVIKVEGPVQISLEDTLGSALKCCGVPQFLKIVPFLPSEDSSPENLREWVISIMHKYVKLMPCQLSDFAMCVLPSAGACKRSILDLEHQQAAGATAKLVDSKLKLLHTRINQLWSLLPDFCTFSTPRDLQSSFSKVCEIFEGIFNDEKFQSVIPHILSTLIILGKSVIPVSNSNDVHALSNLSLQSALPASAPLTVLRAKADSLLPLLLKYIEGIDIGEAKFQATVECIAVWIKLASSGAVSSISKRLLQLILTTTAGSTTGSSTSSSLAAWIAVLLAIIPCLSESLVVLTYKTVRPLLVNASAHASGSGDIGSDALSLQKRAYSVLHTLLTSQKQYVNKFEPGAAPRLAILRLISESLLLSHVSSRHLRFRCMECLLEDASAEDLTEAASLVLGEVLICQKDANKKSRDGALDVLRIFMRGLPVSFLVTQFCSALVAETSSMRSAAVSGLCMLFLEKRSEESALGYLQQLLPTVVTLLQCDGSVDQARAVLSYIRVSCSILPEEVLNSESVLSVIVPAFTTSLAQGGHKQKFSSRCRAIMRKLVSRLGSDEIRIYVPDEDIPLLEYVCRQNRRTERKKAALKDKNKRLDQMMGSDSDDDSDSDED